MKSFEPARTPVIGGDGNGVYPHGDGKGRSCYYYYKETVHYSKTVTEIEHPQRAGPLAVTRHSTIDNGRALE